MSWGRVPTRVAGGDVGDRVMLAAVAAVAALALVAIVVGLLATEPGPRGRLVEFRLEDGTRCVESTHRLSVAVDCEWR